MGICGLMFCLCARSYLNGQNLFYITNEIRIILTVLVLQVASRAYPSMSDVPRWLFLPLLIIFYVGLSRGVGGWIMPIYAGVIAFILYDNVFRRFYGIPILFLGSATASLATLAAIAGPRMRLKIWPLLKIFFWAILIVVLIAIYQIFFRGRSLSFEDIDRLVLNYEAGKIFLNADIGTKIFGFGPGKDFTSQLSLEHTNVIKWLVNSVGSEGIYAHLFHSDLFRLLLNYGIIGTIAIYILMYKYLSRSHFFLLTIGGLFNPLILNPAIILALLYRGKVQ